MTFDEAKTILIREGFRFETAHNPPKPALRSGYPYVSWVPDASSEITIDADLSPEILYAIAIYINQGEL